ncbi:hypothetical protein CRG98_024745, partial [Punica granatum]
MEISAPARAATIYGEFKAINGDHALVLSPPMPLSLPRRPPTFHRRRQAQLPLRLDAGCLIDMLSESPPSCLRRNLLLSLLSLLLLVSVYCLLLLGADDRSPLSLGRSSLYWNSAAGFPSVFLPSPVVNLSH